MDKINDVDCLSCKTIAHFTDLAGSFAGNISEALVGPVNGIFISLIFLWMVVSGYKLLFKQEYLANIIPEFLLM